MRQSIRGYTDAVMEDLSARGELEQAAGELAAIGALVRGSDDLARALTDPAIPAVARRAVVVDLLESQVLPESLRLVTFALAADRATELLADLDWLAARLSSAPEGAPPHEGVLLGRTAASERLEGYATAVLEDLEDEAALSEVEDELFRFMRVVDGSEELRGALTSREVPAAVRRSLVVDLLAPRASAPTTRLAAYLTQVGRPRDYLEHLGGLVERVARERDRRLAQVRAAVDLDEAQRDRLAAALARLIGRRVEVRVMVDRHLLGGFVATIGDTVVDGSLRHRLEVLADRLALPPPTITIQGENR